MVVCQCVLMFYHGLFFFFFLLGIIGFLFLFFVSLLLIYFLIGHYFCFNKLVGLLSFWLIVCLFFN